jgi:hypothetical protein
LLADQDIRRALRIRVADRHADDAETRVVEELELGLGARADLIVLNGRIEGFEIKSDRDSLERLVHQVAAYDAICDRSWLVTTPRFAGAASELLPSWWGILVARGSGEGLRLVRRRAARAHSQQQVGALVGLLWRNELTALCDRYELPYSASRSTVMGLRTSIAHTRLGRRRVAADVRHALLLREGWRAAPPSLSGDAPSRPAARRSGSRSALPPHRRR